MEMKMSDMEILKKYNALRKRYNLPSFEELEAEFEMGQLENQKFILRHIVRQINERLEEFAVILEEVLLPETTVSYMREYNSFSENERKKVYELYSRVKYHHRLSLEMLIESREVLHGDFIRSLMEVYPKIKRDMVWVIKKMKSAWEKEVDVKEDLAYVG